MGLISKSVGFSNFSLEDPSQPLIDPGALYESLGLGRSDAGILVNEKQSWRDPTVYCCIKGISEDIASTAFEVIQEMPDDSTRVAKTHRLWPLLHDSWNKNMSSQVGRKAIIASALGWGNGYAWIKRDGASRAIGLYPLASGKTAPVKIRGDLFYATTQTDTGMPAYLEPEDVLHVMGATQDGFVGISPVGMCKNAYGLSLAAEKFGAQLFGNGARATGILTHKGVMEEEAYDNLKKSMREMATGENALRPVILEEGMDWKQISISPEDAQMIQLRGFQREVLAGLYRFPLHLLGSLQRATNANIEHQGLDYVRYCLRGWAVSLEIEVNRKLLGGPFVSAHNFNDLQRGDFASQTTGLQILRNIGVYSTNACLRVLKQNPIPAEDGGDILYVQGANVNLQMLLPENGGNVQGGGDPDSKGTQKTDPSEGDPAAKTITVIGSSSSGGGNTIVGVFGSLFRDGFGRLLNRSERDENSVRCIFHPIVKAMAQSLLAAKFGNATLTDKDEERISAIVGEFQSAASAWQKSQAAKLAELWTAQVYQRLSGELSA